MKKSTEKHKLYNTLTCLIMTLALVFPAYGGDYDWQVNTLAKTPSLRGSALVDGKMWVTGSKGSIYTSEDGGLTWLDKSVAQHSALDFRDIEVFDQDTAIIMSVGSGDSSKLFKTQNGGDSWQLLYQNKEAEGFFDSIDFWNKQVGLLLGDPVDGFYVVKKTEDGGKTWRRITINKLPELREKEAAFAASGNTLLVGNNGKAWITTGGFSASVYVSNDWGESWQRQPVPLYQETQTAGGYGLAINAKQELFVLGGDYQQRPASYLNIARFNKIWQPVDAGKRGLRTAMSCSSSVCIATGKTGSDLSFDQGASWQTFDNKTAESGDQGFYTIANEGDIFIAAGANGKVAVAAFK
ncbi:WD40/YVTN/BNR-like repeat-containing protein [Thalassotalea sediminis]|uniref:WD40/YVTN/BNR-like repeat-containing protein n=1 Tax=Thalassotalea sediminis TaxID=1759089 RepID=UPI002573588F|nr:YCF48-related protein [Thalassotalea sediminis]